jgi:hypothetical protein
MGVVMCCKLRCAKKHWDRREEGSEEKQAALRREEEPVTLCMSATFENTSDIVRSP